jgi:hypothetical protein
MNIRDEPQRFSLSKLECARRQIETAIKLWFEEGDTVSMHTVTAAAHRLVQDLLEDQGKTLAPFEPSYLEKGREVETKRMFREAETFFKHAKDDPQEILDFNPQWTEVYLLLAIQGYTELTHEENLLMTAYLFRCGFRWPHVFAPELHEKIGRDFDIDKLRQLPRSVFLREISAVLRSKGYRSS